MRKITKYKTIEEFVSEVCGGKGSQKKKKKRARSLAKMVETDVDIFADDYDLQINETRDD